MSLNPSVNDLRKVAPRSGARDIGNVEIDVILSYLLQLFTEKRITDHVAFKGGTLLRKMFFGPRGRLSTDLDFTLRSTIPVDDLMLMMLDALSAPYHGLSFRFRRWLRPARATRLSCPSSIAWRGRFLMQGQSPMS
jgi:hypothetical protein